jgi:hypothetical protein
VTGLLVELGLGLAVLLTVTAYGGWALVQILKWRHEVHERNEMMKAVRRLEGEWRSRR